MNPIDLMESVGSNSPASSISFSGIIEPTQPITDRIIRALTHRLALLHRSDSHFHILGSTGNVYTVTVSSHPTCTCPDHTVPCKHILFVLLRVLSLPLDDPCIFSPALHNYQVARILSLPTSLDALAGERAIRRFQELIDGRVSNRDGERRNSKGGTCPVCLEEMMEGEVVTCTTCGNSVHDECFRRWRRSKGRRAASCVVCRAKWRERREVERYLNLGGYTGEEGGEGEERSCGT